MTRPSPPARRPSAGARPGRWGILFGGKDPTGRASNSLVRNPEYAPVAKPAPDAAVPHADPPSTPVLFRRGSMATRLLPRDQRDRVTETDFRPLPLWAEPQFVPADIPHDPLADPRCIPQRGEGGPQESLQV